MQEARCRQTALRMALSPIARRACRPLRWEAPLARFKERLDSGEDVFGDLLDRFLLHNTHRVTVVTLPDSRLAAQVRHYLPIRTN